MPNSVYPIRLYGDPVLRRKAQPIQDVTAPVAVPGFGSVRLDQVAEAMLSSMYEARGVGLAAPQVGLSIRMFVAAEYDDDEAEGDDGRPLRSKVLREIVMINPVLETIDKRQDASYQEGCLSVPGIYEDGVKRDRAVRVRYLDLDGRERVEEAEDYLARVFQHEIDHLNGVFFLDKLPPEVAEHHRKDLAEMQRKARAYLKTLGAKTPAGSR